MTFPLKYAIILIMKIYHIKERYPQSDHLTSRPGEGPGHFEKLYQADIAYVTTEDPNYIKIVKDRYREPGRVMRKDLFIKEYFVDAL